MSYKSKVWYPFVCAGCRELKVVTGSQINGGKKWCTTDCGEAAIRRGVTFIELKLNFKFRRYSPTGRRLLIQNQFSAGSNPATGTTL